MAVRKFASCDLSDWRLPCQCPPKPFAQYKDDTEDPSAVDAKLDRRGLALVIWMYVSGAGARAASLSMSRRLAYDNLSSSVSDPLSILCGHNGASIFAIN